MKKKLTWTREEPVKSGFYVWRRNLRTKDQVKWDMYYAETSDNFRTLYWDNGVVVYKPSGGYWLGPIDIEKMAAAEPI